MPKYLINNNGNIAEEATVETSTGSDDADKVAHLNADGVLDASIVNSTDVSAGAADEGKLAALNGDGVLDASIVNSVDESGGAGDADKVVRLGASGRIHESMMPVGIGADTASIQASENLAAGDYVNLHNSSGSRVRKADASNGREAQGFVLASWTSGQNATVYFEGTNTQVSSRTPGAVQFLSGSSPGQSTETAPTTAGHIVQRLGFATSSTSVNFEAAQPITLA